LQKHFCDSLVVDNKLLKCTIYIVFYSCAKIAFVNFIKYTFSKNGRDDGYAAIVGLATLFYMFLTVTKLRPGENR
jgi:hypothetical protein